MTSKGTRYKEEQIIPMLKEVERGTMVAEVCRKNAVSEQIKYRWRSKYSGIETSELQQLYELEAENSRRRRYTYDEITARNKFNLSIFWLRDESLEDSANLPPTSSPLKSSKIYNPSWNNSKKSYSISKLKK